MKRLTKDDIVSNFPIIAYPKLTNKFLLCSD